MINGMDGNRDVIDEVIGVSTDEALSMKRRLAREEGVCAGISSGANLAAARRLSERSDRPLRIVVILADSGDRYLSME